MIDEAALAQMNGAYSMPSDAGPEWRAVQYLSLEEALKLSPEERLEAHQRALNLLLENEAARKPE
jgi:hypothetical protein